RSAQRPRRPPVRRRGRRAAAGGRRRGRGRAAGPGPAYPTGGGPRRGGAAGVAAGPRVRYLHTRPGAADDVVAAWRAVLGPAAWVGGRDEAIAAGWFGPVPAGPPRRIGAVVAICRDDHVVLATGLEPAPIGSMVAFHGSYTAAEMAIPLL